MVTKTAPPSLAKIQWVTSNVFIDRNMRQQPLTAEKHFYLLAQTHFKREKKTERGFPGVSCPQLPIHCWAVQDALRPTRQRSLWQESPASSKGWIQLPWPRGAQLQGKVCLRELYCVQHNRFWPKNSNMLLSGPGLWTAMFQEPRRRRKWCFQKEKGFSAICFPWEISTTLWRRKVARKEAEHEYVFQSHSEQTCCISQRLKLSKYSCP